MTSLSVIASAPANTMLMGEHAVLLGHSALVCALTQRIYVRAKKRADAHIVIVCELGCFQCAGPDLSHQASQKSVFSFVLQALLVCDFDQGVELTIETEFGHTLGLGSSAAVTVATLGAMALLATDRFDAQLVMQLGIECIRKVQGRGSGADVAASALGGIIKFCGHPLKVEKVTLAPQSWQAAPSLKLVYCGYKTPTAQVIEQVAQAAAQQPQRFAALYQQMGACVEAATGALSNADWHTFASAMNQYQNLLRKLGVSDAATESIIELAQKQAQEEALFGAKISGSGLGDCILLLGTKQLDWPHTQMAVSIDLQGLRQEPDLPSQALTETLL